MRYDIIIEPIALEDLQNIYEYISRNDFASKAKKLLIKFPFGVVKPFNALLQYPSIYRKHDLSPSLSSHHYYR